jgi:hypothetical protein
MSSTVSTTPGRCWLEAPPDPPHYTRDDVDEKPGRNDGGQRSPRPSRSELRTRFFAKPFCSSLTNSPVSVGRTDALEVDGGDAWAVHLGNVLEEPRRDTERPHDRQHNPDPMPTVETEPPHGRRIARRRRDCCERKEEAPNSNLWGFSGFPRASRVTTTR